MLAIGDREQMRQRLLGLNALHADRVGATNRQIPNQPRTTRRRWVDDRERVGELIVDGDLDTRLRRRHQTSVPPLRCTSHADERACNRSAVPPTYAIEEGPRNASSGTQRVMLAPLADPCSPDLRVNARVTDA